MTFSFMIMMMQICTSQSFQMVKVDSYTTADMIDESMHQLDQLLQDVQERRSECDQRDEFQGNDDHVAALVILDSELFIEF